MSYNYNRATLVGRLTRDPELKQVNDTLSKSSFTIAVNRNYKKEDGTTDTDFIPIIVWGKKALISIQILEKGSPVLVSGRIQVRKYEEEDQQKWITEIIAENFQILTTIKKNKEEVVLEKH